MLPFRSYLYSTDDVAPSLKPQSVDILDKLAKFYGLTIDQIVNLEDNVPKEVPIEDKGLIEKVKLIQELDQEEKNMIFKMIDTFLTKKKFKDFFNKSIAAL